MSKSQGRNGPEVKSQGRNNLEVKSEQSKATDRCGVKGRDFEKVGGPE